MVTNRDETRTAQAPDIRDNGTDGDKPTTIAGRRGPKPSDLPKPDFRCFISWRSSIPSPYPWGDGLTATPDPLALLVEPLAFIETEALSPGEFLAGAKALGYELELGHLHELHRIGALVPFFRILASPADKERSVVPNVLVDRAIGGLPIGGSFELALRMHRDAQVVDPARRPYRPWGRGLRVQRPYGVTYEPSVFYGAHQLLGIRQLAAICRRMERIPRAIGPDAFRCKSLDPLNAAHFDRGRSLAVVLHAIDAHFLPHIVHFSRNWAFWTEHDLSFSTSRVLEAMGVTAEEMKTTAESLLTGASKIDPLGSLYELVRYADANVWREELQHEARFAMELRVAAEILLRAVEDLGRDDLTDIPPRAARKYRDPLDDRIPLNSSGLDHALTARGLSPHPSVLLALEGKTEMILMPRVLEMVFQGPVPPTLVEPVFMDTVDRDLDLLVRHVMAFRFDQLISENAVLLSRPVTQILIAVDPEKRYRTVEKQEAERRKLVRRLFEAVPFEYRTPATRDVIDRLVHVTTWVGGPWEFANFTNRDLTTAIMQVTRLPRHVTRQQVHERVKQMRDKGKPRIQYVTSPWRVRVDKVKLAEATWPALQQKVRKRMESRTLNLLPAGRVAEQALRLAIGSPHRSTALRYQ